MVAIPNFARTNRVGTPADYPTDDEPDRFTKPKPQINSKVWI